MRDRILKAVVLGLSLSALPVLGAVPDGMITSKTKMSLWTTAGVKSTAIHVDTNDGVVTLFGKVNTPEQKTLAEKTAREISGVKSVTSLLQVVPEAMQKRVERTDKETMAQVTKALENDKALKDSKITVKSVDKGLVLLGGEAKTYSDHLRAVSVVDRVPGVVQVASEVKAPDEFGKEERMTFMVPAKGTQKGSTGTDMRISMAVKLRLLTAAEVPSTEINVDTQDAVVTLFGIVPTAAVKAAAATEAGKVKGVARIENQLEVVASSERQRVEAKDDDISRDISLTLTGRPEFKSVTVDVKNGAVQLTGTVYSAWDEINALRLIKRVNGVRTVEDKLKVAEEKTGPTDRY